MGPLRRPFSFGPNVVAHRTRYAGAGRRSPFRKKAYGVDTVELQLAEAEVVGAFERRGARLVRAVELSSNPAQDEHVLTYVFARPGAHAALG